MKLLFGQGIVSLLDGFLGIQLLFLFCKIAQILIQIGSFFNIETILNRRFIGQVFLVEVLIGGLQLTLLSNVGIIQKADQFRMIGLHLLLKGCQFLKKIYHLFMIRCTFYIPEWLSGGNLLILLYQ